MADIELEVLRERVKQLEADRDAWISTAKGAASDVMAMAKALHKILSETSDIGVVQIAEKALLIARDTLPEDDWRLAECDNCGWEVEMLASRVGNICTQCHLGALVEQPVEDTLPNE